MKTITLTDDQFDTLFEFVNQKVESIVDASVDYENIWETKLSEDYFEIDCDMSEHTYGHIFKNLKWIQDS